MGLLDPHLSKGKLDACTQFIKPMRWPLFFCFSTFFGTSASARTIVVVDVDDNLGNVLDGSRGLQHDGPVTLFHVKPLDSPKTFGQLQCGAREELLAVEMEILKKRGLDLGPELTEEYLRLSHQTRDYTLTEQDKTLNIDGMRTAQDLAQFNQPIYDLPEALALEERSGNRNFHIPKDFSTDAFLNYLRQLPEEASNLDL